LLVQHQLRHPRIGAPQQRASLVQEEGRLVRRIGDRVAVLASKALAKELADRGVLSGGKLLIKRVVAAAGDTVCRKGGEVTLNGRPVATARSADSEKRALPIWNGCVTLTTSDVFLLGDTAGSYDGRYFGVTRASEIVGRADLVLPF